MAGTIKQRIALDGGKELKRELEEFGAAGRKAFKDLQTAAAQTKGLPATFFNSLKQAEVQIKGMAKAFEDAGKKIQNVGRTLTTNLTLPIVGLGAGILKQAGDFEKAMNSFAVNAAVAGTALEDAKAKAQELGQASIFSSTEAAQGMTELAKVGIDFTTIMGGAAKAMVDLAAANDTGLASSASVVGDVINQFKLSASQLPSIVNSITGATIESKLSFDDYRLAIGQAGGAAGALGVEFEQFNAVLAATASSFASGSDAGTSFKTFLTRMVPQSKEAAAAMDKLGIKFFDAQGKMKSMSEIAQLLQDKLGKLSQEDLTDNVKTIFGVDAMRTAIALMKQGGKGIDEMMAKLKATDAADIAATRVKGLWGEFDQLKSSIENLSIAIGASGFLKFATDIVIKLTEWTQELAKTSPEMLRLGTIIGGVAASIGPLLLALGLMTRGFGLVLVGASSAIGAIRALGAALLFLGANPIVAALALIGVTIAIWATRTSEATAALRVHEDLIGKVGSAYDQAGRKVAEMSQQVKDAALIQARLSQDAAGKGLSGAIDEAINSIQQFDGLLPHAADQLFEVFKQFHATKDVEAFRAEVAKIGAANPELGKLSQQFLDISENAHKLNQDSQESANFIGLLTGKFTDSEFAAKQAALGIAGWGKETVAATTQANAAIEETKTKVESLGQTITVFRGGGSGGQLSKEVFNIVDGVAVRAEQSKTALDGVGESAQKTGEKVKAVADDIASHIRTVPDALTTNSITPAVDGIVTDIQRIKPAADEAAGGLRDALGAVDAGGGLASSLTAGVDGVVTDLDRLAPAAQQAATAVAQPFQGLPSVFSQIFSGLGSLIQGGFGNLTSVIRSLASQIRSEISSIIAALQAAVAQAQRLRAQASSSSSSSSGGGSQGGFASGGHVRGAGGPKTDSILAWLSNGEFVMQAAAVKKLGVGFLSALNNGVMPSLKSLRGFSMGGVVDGFNRSMSQMSIPRFAGGGFANVPASPSSSTTHGRTPFVLQLPGGEQIDDMTIGNIALNRLQKLAIGSSLTSTGRKPLRGKS